MKRKQLNSAIIYLSYLPLHTPFSHEWVAIHLACIISLLLGNKSSGRTVYHFHQRTGHLCKWPDYK